MAFRSKQLVSSMALEFADGTFVELKRVPYLHDVFLDPNGRVVKLQMPEVELHTTGKAMFRYENTTLMLARAMMDTYYPGWDEHENVAVAYDDGNPTNCAVSNLAIKPTKHPGRPSTNLHRRIFDALQMLNSSLNLQEAAKAYELSPQQLFESCEKILPDLAEKLETPGKMIRRKSKIAMNDSFGLSDDEVRSNRQRNHRLYHDRINRTAARAAEKAAAE